jgi:hypothetical protein
MRTSLIYVEKHSPAVGRRYRRRMYGLVLVPPLAAVVTLVLAPDPHGHWSEHLSAAYFGVSQLVLVVVLAGLLSRRSLSILLLAALGVIAAGITFQVIGNFQVANSIWATRDDPGFGDGYVQGHDRAETGDLLVIFGGAAVAFVAGFTRRVPLKVAVLALFMVIIPPWIWPGAGALMLLLYGLTSKAGFARPSIAIGMPEGDP